MKELLTNLWNGPASSFAGAITAGLTFVLASGTDLPQWLLLSLGSLSAVLSFVAGPIKTKKP